MKEYPNFYENLKEAVIRLRNTVVMYDGEPNQILAITDHMKDGIFRVYSFPIGIDEKFQWPGPVSDLPAEHSTLGPLLDEWMKNNPKSVLTRKQMNSPKFNRFRPFPLGMCNHNNEHVWGTYYLERQPLRPKTEQGLIPGMVFETAVTAAAGKPNPTNNKWLVMNSAAVRACILGEHPTPQECLAALLDPKIANTAAAFNRHFALVLGPMEMIFLAYKGDIVGVLPKNDFTQLKLGKNFRYAREVIDALNLFESIII